MENPSHAKSALVVFSGGQDSTTCLYWAIKHFEEVRTLTFDYGQRHRIELECAKKVAQLADVPHEVLSISTFVELGGNALTGDEEIQAHQRNIIERLAEHLCTRTKFNFIEFCSSKSMAIGNRKHRDRRLSN